MFGMLWLATSAVFAPQGEAPRTWQAIGSTDTTVVLIDVANMPEDGDVRRIPAAFAYASTKEYGAVESLADFDCEGHRHRLTSITAYDHDGKRLGTDQSPMIWKAHNQRSLFGLIEAVVCGRAAPSGLTWTQEDVPVKGAKEMLAARKAKPAAN